MATRILSKAEQYAERETLNSITIEAQNLWNSSREDERKTVLPISFARYEALKKGYGAGFDEAVKLFKEKKNE